MLGAKVRPRYAKTPGEQVVHRLARGRRRRARGARRCPAPSPRCSPGRPPRPLWGEYPRGSEPRLRPHRGHRAARHRRIAHDPRRGLRASSGAALRRPGRWEPPSPSATWRPRGRSGGTPRTRPATYSRRDRGPGPRPAGRRRPRCRAPVGWPCRSRTTRSSRGARCRRDRRRGVARGLLQIDRARLAAVPERSSTLPDPVRAKRGKRSKSFSHDPYTAFPASARIPEGTPTACQAPHAHGDQRRHPRAPASSPNGRSSSACRSPASRGASPSTARATRSHGDAGAARTWHVERRYVGPWLPVTKELRTAIVEVGKPTTDARVRRRRRPWRGPNGASRMSEKT